MKRFVSLTLSFVFGCFVVGCGENDPVTGETDTGAETVATSSEEDPAPSDSSTAADTETLTADLPTPRPPEPCEDDLGALNGRADVDLGRVCQSGKVDFDPLEMGPYHQAISKHSVDNPFSKRFPLTVTVYAPSVDYKEPLDGPMPLVILLAGFSGRHPEYSFYSNHFASHGFAVVGMDFGDGDPLTDLLGGHDLINQDKNAQEVIAVLDWALAQSPLAGHLDIDKIAVAGHSLGGKIAFFAASMDDRIDLVIGWDPQNAGGGAPCMINPSGCNDFPVAPNCQVEDPGLLHLMHAESLVFAARDTMIMVDRHTWAEHFYRGAPSPASLVLIPGAQHTDWGQSDNNEVVRITRRTQMALLLSRFKSVKGLEKYLPDGDDLDNYPVVTLHESK